MEEGLSFVDQYGVPALSMRKLGARLGVEAMSLYEYISSKDDLLNAIADRVASELVLPDSSIGTWQTRLRNAVTSWVRIEGAHPGGFRLLYRAREGTDRERAITEEIMAALSVAGFQVHEVALLYQTLVCFLDSALLHWPRSTWNIQPNWEYAAAVTDPSRFHYLAEVAPYSARLSWDDVFWTGFDLFLHGIEDRLVADVSPESRKLPG